MFTIFLSPGLMPLLPEIVVFLSNPHGKMDASNRDHGATAVNIRKNPFLLDPHGLCER
jgi:hypothetical protein